MLPPLQSGRHERVETSGESDDQASRRCGNSRSRCVPARLPRHVRDADHVREDQGRKVAVKVAGDPTHPTTAGTLCTKVARYLERTYHPDRVLHPLKRVGAKGTGAFARVSWDEALSAIAARLSAIAERDPQRIVPYSYAGTMGLVQGEGMAARFFHKLGASFSIARFALPRVVKRWRTHSA